MSAICSAPSYIFQSKDFLTLKDQNIEVKRHTTSQALKHEKQYSLV